MLHSVYKYIATLYSSHPSARSYAHRAVYSVTALYCTLFTFSVFLFETAPVSCKRIKEAEWKEILFAFVIQIIPGIKAITTFNLSNKFER